VEDGVVTKVAIVGAGNMAIEHAPAFADVPGVELVGIYSRTRERAEQVAAAHGIQGVYGSLADLYKKAKPDLVVVTVFETAMRDVAIDCCAFPWTILLEKPPGMDLSHAEAIAETAATTGHEILVGLNRRFLGSTRAASEDLADNDSPRFVHVQDQQSLDTARALKHPEAVVRTWMYANSIHLVDYLRHFGRGPITAVTPITRWDFENPGIVLAKVEFASGDIGLYEGIWNGPGPWAVTVSTPEKRWELRPLEKAVFQRAGSRTLEAVEPDPIDGCFKPGFRVQAERAVAAAKGRPHDVPTLTEALETMRLIRDVFA
jgi:predicted dehydrogenase